MASSTLGGVVEFLTRFGLYDVVLPFLLVFTIVFAVLEKTRILGKDDKGNPKANLDAMVAFAMALMFIAATKLVQALNVALPFVVLMLIAFICIILLVAAFYKDGEFNFMEAYEGMKTPVLIVVIIGVFTAFIFALGWADPLMNWIKNNWNSTAAAAIFFGLLVIVLMYFIVKTPGEKKPTKSEKKE